jgi:transcriptional regulator with XRE-family HTH domain
MKKEFNKDWFSNEIRFKKGKIPLVDCAKLIGISAATLSRVQNGKEPDVMSYHRICVWLKMPMDKFFTTVSEPIEIPNGGFRASKTPSPSDRL